MKSVNLLLLRNESSSSPASWTHSQLFPLQLSIATILATMEDSVTFYQWRATFISAPKYTDLWTTKISVFNMYQKTPRKPHTSPQAGTNSPYKCQLFAFHDANRKQTPIPDAQYMCVLWHTFGISQKLPLSANVEVISSMCPFTLRQSQATSLSSFVWPKWHQLLYSPGYTGHNSQQ